MSAPETLAQYEIDRAREHEPKPVTYGLAEVIGIDRLEHEIHAKVVAELGEDSIVHGCIYDSEVDPSSELARCFRSLKAARSGNSIALDAITTALTQLHGRMDSSRHEERFGEIYDSQWKPEKE